MLYDFVCGGRVCVEVVHHELNALDSLGLVKLIRISSCCLSKGV